MTDRPRPRGAGQDGETADRAVPRWRGLLKSLQAAFPSPWRDLGEDPSFENTFRFAVALLDGMKHNRAFQDQNAWQGYLGSPDLPDYSGCEGAALAQASMRPVEVIEELVGAFNGMPNWNHPQTMANVIPPANTAAIIGATLASVFSPNIADGEYSWNIAKTEMESAAMVSRLIGWDPHASGGVYTSGGTGCYLYGIKLALTTVLGRESRYTGVREEGQILVSRAGHLARLHCADWTGVGMNNVRPIAVDERNRMSIPHLQEELEASRREGKPVVAVVCTMGTTDAFGIDPIAEVREVVDGFKNVRGLPRPFVYADAVIGWSWLAFGGYDFEANPLQFSRKGLEVMARNYGEIAPLHHADAVGIDFHKTGWAPPNCSLFMVKDYAKFASLMERPSPGRPHGRTAYNPLHYTLETSRTGAYSLAGWATLRLFGREGFQVMLGRIIEVQIFFRQLLSRERTLVCLNPDDHGFVTLFRVYPRHVNAEEQYERELSDPSCRGALTAHNLLQQRVANKLFAMLRDRSQKVPGWENPPYTGFTTGYRPPACAPDAGDNHPGVYALKAFPMSPNANELSMLVVRNYVLKARDLVIEELLDGRGKDRGPGAPASTSRPAPRTAATWWGDNEEIALEYLVPPTSTVETGPALTFPRSRALDAVSKEPAQIADILGKIPVCAHLSEDQLRDLTGIGRTEKVEAGKVLFLEGDRADKVYLILDGRVRIYKRDRDGSEVELATIAGGEFFGEMALFDQGLRSAAVQALDPCELFAFDGEQFLAMVLG